MSFYIFNPQYEGALSYIHPLKVKSVMELLDDTIPEYIDLVIIFGSSVDLTCMPFSDVDLYVISEENKKAYEYLYRRCKKLGIKVDILSATKEDFMRERGQLF